ncbi:MAG: cation:proton antiporter [Chromatiales bacterium]|nr:cation:proton antiporter [Chromatiales bacterium]
MLAVWIAAAFALGLLARQLGLPPLIGFLTAGFLLNASGIERVPALTEVAHLGVLLLLFSVGLKLRLRNLIRPEVWGVALLQFGVALVVAFLALRGAAGASLPLILVVASALSFSSTVLAAKVLEERREIRAFHGRVAIGILIVQDLIAVAILGVNDGRAVTWLTALVLLLPLAQPLIRKLLDLAGHGELLVLLGSVLALGIGGYGFEAIGLSGELGALLIGMLLATHPKAVELSDSLWGLKEFFLVGFFLSIGLTGLPTWHTMELAVVPIALLPLKVLLYFLLLLGFGLSARTGFLAGLGLATYSEFGLIVMAAGVEGGLVPAEWLVATAIAVAVSFAIAAPLSRYSHDIFTALERFLRFFERDRRHPDDEPISLGRAEIVIAGMGRVGTGAYNHARELGRKVVGLDSDLGKVEKHLSEGRRVVYADAEDPSLWHRLNLDQVRVIMLALPDAEAKVLASEQLRRRGFRGLISATYVWPEEQAPILAAGADITYNYFAEAGVGLAADTFEALAPGGESRPNRQPRPATPAKPTIP